MLTGNGGAIQGLASGVLTISLSTRLWIGRPTARERRVQQRLQEQEDEGIAENLQDAEASEEVLTRRIIPENQCHVIK